jgi:hypothetical protein
LLSLLSVQPVPLRAPGNNREASIRQGNLPCLLVLVGAVLKEPLVRVEDAEIRALDAIPLKR